MARRAPAVTEPLPPKVPQEQAAEEALIGCALTYQGAWRLAREHCAPGDFYHPALAAIAEALDAAGGAADLILVAAELRRTGTISQLKAYNGEAYLAHLANEVASAAEVARHAQLVRRSFLRREQLRLAELLQRRLLDGQDPEQLPRQLAELRQQEEQVGRPPPPLPVPSQRIAELYARPREPPVPLGISTVDAELQGGLLRGRPAVLIARTGRGKTSFKIQVILHWLSLGWHVLDVQTELPEEEGYARYLGQVLRCPWREVLDQQGTASGPGELAQLARRHLDRGLTMVEYDGSRTLDELVDEYVRQRGVVPLVAVDVVQDLATFQLRSASVRLDPRSAMREVSFQCKTLAKRLGTIALLVSHTSRAFVARTKTGREMKASDFESAGRDSADLEQDAGAVFYLDTHDQAADGSAHCDLQIAKQQGQKTTVPLRYLGAIGRFEPSAPRQAAAAKSVEPAILEILGKVTHRKGLSGSKLIALLREKRIGKRDGDVYAALGELAEKGDLKRYTSGRSVIYQHSKYAPTGEQTEMET